MTPVFSARRRADEFEALISGSNSVRLHDVRHLALVQVVEQIRAVPVPSPRAEFVSDLRERLMVEAETVLRPVTTSAAEARLRLAPANHRRDRRVASVVGGMAIAGATVSMAVAAQSALPGDALYPIKRAMEGAQTGVNLDAADKGSALLANASGRLAEIAEITRLGTPEGIAAVPVTLEAFSDQAVEASDLLLADFAEHGQQALIEELRNFTAESMATLTELQASLPAEAADELRAAGEALTIIDAQAALACPDCGGEGITSIPRFLLTAAGVANGTTAPVAPVIFVPSKPAKAPQEQTTTAGTNEPSDPTLTDDGTLDIPTPASGGDDDTTETDSGQNPIDELATGLTGGGTTTSAPAPAPEEDPSTDSADTADSGVLDGAIDPLVP